jgi:hypothetical protein
MVRARPTAKSVKATAPRTPTSRPTTRAKMKTVREKRMKRKRGMPVMAKFMPRKVWMLMLVSVKQHRVHHAANSPKASDSST